MNTTAIETAKLRQGPGRFILHADHIDAPCGKLPIPLHSCPACGTHLKPQQAFRIQMVSMLHLFRNRGCRFETACRHGTAYTSVCSDRPLPGACPMCDCEIDRRVGGGLSYMAGLVWLPAELFPTLHDWTKRLHETASGRVAWRIERLPAALRIPYTPVLVALASGRGHPDGSQSAQIVASFTPTDLTYHVGTDDGPGRIRNITALAIQMTPATAAAPMR